jgi:hypothetical protein
MLRRRGSLWAGIRLYISIDHNFHLIPAALAHLGERQTEVNFCPSCIARVFWRHCVRSTEAAFTFVEPSLVFVSLQD